MTSIDLEEYLDHNDVEISEDTLIIAHHGILGMKWGRLNGPPYPLGSGDHSAGEKKAASKAGIKPGENSGKGSIANVKGGSQNGSSKPKSSSTRTKKPETPEEHRAKIDAAIKSGDAKKIKKYASEMTTNELNDAVNRASALQRLNPQGSQNQTKRMSAEEKAHENERQAALNSGDKKRILSVAKESSANELQNALNKANTIETLNRDIAKAEPAKKTVADRIDDVASALNRAGKWYDAGTGAWNRFAKQYNMLNKDGNDLFVFGEDTSKLRSAADKARQKNQEEVDKAMQRAAKRSDWKSLDKYKAAATSKQIKDIDSYLSDRAKLDDYIKYEGHPPKNKNDKGDQDDKDKEKNDDNS